MSDNVCRCERCGVDVPQYARICMPCHEAWKPTTEQEWVERAVVRLGRPQPHHLAAYARFLDRWEPDENDTETP